MIHSELFKPNPTKACDRCVFGTGPHARWCRHEESVKVDPGWVARLATTYAHCALELHEFGGPVDETEEGALNQRLRDRLKFTRSQLAKCGIRVSA